MNDQRKRQLRLREQDEYATPGFERELQRAETELRELEQSDDHVAPQ